MNNESKAKIAIFGGLGLMLAGGVLILTALTGGIPMVIGLVAGGVSLAGGLTSGLNGSDWFPEEQADNEERKPLVNRKKNSEAPKPKKAAELTEAAGAPVTSRSARGAGVGFNEG